MRVVRIVRAADEIETGVLHQLHVAVDGGIRHGVAPSGLVLVHVGAAEVAVLAVEKKALVGRPLDGAEAERRLEAVALAPRHVERRDGAVQRGRLGTPQLEARQPRGLLRDVQRLPRRHADGRVGQHGDGGAAAVGDARAHRHLDRFAAVVAHLRRHAHGAAAARQARRGHGRAGPRDVHVVCRHEPDVAVDAAAEDMFAGARRERRVPGVVDADGDHVAPRMQGAGQVDGKAGIAAAVARDPAAVGVHLGRLERGFELERPAAPGGPLRQHEILAVPAVADVHLGRLEVRRAETVRETHGLPVAVVEVDLLGTADVAQVEAPAGVEILPLARGGCFGRGCGMPHAGQYGKRHGGGSRQADQGRRLRTHRCSR